MDLKDFGLDMKNILLITEPRTGSSSLMKSIASAYDFDWQFEPDKKDKLKIKNNTVAKIIVDVNRGQDYYLNLMNQFSKTILLSRRNIIEQSEAFWALLYINNGIYTEKWNENELPENLKKRKDYKERYQTLVDKKLFLLDLSLKTNKKINYYEDVFKSKSLHEKDVKLDLEYFGPQHKLRVKGHTSLL